MTKEQAIREALELALEALNLVQIRSEDGEDLTPKKAREAITAIKEALAQPEQEKERCVGCEACIDTACGRDECPKGWPKAAHPEQRSVSEQQDPVAKPKLIGWRTENFLWETDDIKKAQNWEPNIGVLPIFEGDPNTQLTTPQQRKPLTDEEIYLATNQIDRNERGWAVKFARAVEAAHGIKE